MMERAKAALISGREQEAAAAAYEVWQQARGDKFVDVWAGQVLAKCGQLSRAAEVYCASEKLPAGNWEAYWQLGSFLLSAGLLARAIEFFEEAVRIEPDALQAHIDLAATLVKAGRSAEAAKASEEVRRLDPELFE